MPTQYNEPHWDELLSSSDSKFGPVFRFKVLAAIRDEQKSIKSWDHAFNWSLRLAAVAMLIAGFYWGNTFYQDMEFWWTEPQWQNLIEQSYTLD